MKNRSLLIFGITLLIFASNPCLAEIYKYKDPQGRWQYSDKPPKGESSKIHIDGNSKTPQKENNDPINQNLNTTDIKSLLHTKYKPGNLIEQASLATISIETHLAIGSGFFISKDGYILTNKHVIRPSASNKWQETNTQFNKQKKEFDKNKKLLADEAEDIEAMSAELKRRQIEIENEQLQSSRDYLTYRYNDFKDGYLSRKQHYNKLKAEFDERKRVFDKKRSEFNIKSSMANVTKTFKIILKNEQPLTVRLVAVSKKYDLALLKLDKHITPYIKMNQQKLHQTMKVYAVGSPLGIRDSVTSGIITGIKDGYVLTDTKILPGNSGGPLLNKEGAVIGVNTARVSEFVSAEGLGIAIPISIANKEFSRYLAN